MQQELHVQIIQNTESVCNYRTKVYSAQAREMADLRVDTHALAASGVSAQRKYSCL